MLICIPRCGLTHMNFRWADPGIMKEKRHASRYSEIFTTQSVALASLSQTAAVRIRSCIFQPYSAPGWLICAKGSAFNMISNQVAMVSRRPRILSRWISRPVAATYVNLSAPWHGMRHCLALSDCGEFRLTMPVLPPLPRFGVVNCRVGGLSHQSDWRTFSALCIRNI